MSYASPFTMSVKHSVSSTSENEPFYPEVIVAVGLRVLGCGDTHTSLADAYGMSDAIEPVIATWWCYS